MIQLQGCYHGKSLTLGFQIYTMVTRQTLTRLAHIHIITHEKWVAVGKGDIDNGTSENDVLSPVHSVVFA